MAIPRGKDLRELAENVVTSVFFGGKPLVEGDPSYAAKKKDYDKRVSQISKTINAIARGKPDAQAFQEGFGSAVQDDIKNAVSDAAGFYINPLAYYEREIGKLGDEETLTDEQLQTKLNLLEAYGQETRSGISNFQRVGGGNRIIPLGDGFSEIVEQDIPTLDKHGPASGMEYNLPPPLRISEPESPLELEPIYNRLPAPDTTTDRERIRQLLESREQRRVSEAELDQFIASLPDELARGREQFLGGEVDRARDFFSERLAPEIQQGLNTRGLLFSGDLTSELTRGAAGLYSNIQEKEVSLAEQDDLYFQNAAYQATLQKEIEAGADMTGRLAYERGQARTAQERSFQRTQTDLSNQFSEGLFARQQERALAQQKRDLERQQRQANDANQSKLIGDIAGTVGNIAGTVAGTKLASANIVKSGVTT